jgi:glutamine amidotransferase
MTKVAILDYGLGNLRSVMRGLERSGARPVITADIEEASAAEGIVLPGVGAFSQGMEQLRAIQDTLIAYVREAPVLGICLGMQMLMEWSEENGIHRGLGLVPGTVRRFTKADGFKVPHMGWNTIHTEENCPLFSGIPQDAYVYFVHSYYADTAPEYRASTTSYINPFASALRNGNAYGVQFHPEKSGAVGLKILENFIGLL